MNAVLAAEATNAGGLVFRELPFGAALPAELSAWLRQHQPHPIFGTPDWFHQLAEFKRTLGLAEEVCDSVWVVVYRDNAPILALPLEKYRTRLGQLQLRLVNNFYTPQIDLFIDRAQLTSEQAWNCLLQTLDQLYPTWLSLWVEPLTVAQHAQLRGAVAPRHASFTQQISTNHAASFTGLAEYWKNRPSQLRNTLKRKGKLLANEAHRFELATSPTESQVAHYWQVYEASWKPQEPLPSFINWLIGWSAQRGFLRLGLLHIGEQVAACQCWLVYGDTAYIFKLAQNANTDRYSPGSMLTEYIINTLAESDQIRHIDFLLGDNAFKAMWMDRNSPVFGIEVVNRKRLMGVLLAYWYQSRKTLARRPGWLARLAALPGRRARPDTVGAVAD